MRPADLKRLQKAHMAAGDAHHALGVAYGLALESLADEMARPKAFESPREFVKPAKQKKEFNLHVAAPVESGPAGMSKIERKILVSLAQLERPASIVTVGIVAEFSHRSSTVDTALAKLKRQGFVDGSKSSLRVTAAGREAIGAYPELPRGHQLLQYWKGKLKSPAGRILNALHGSAPQSIETIAATEGFSPRSSTVDTAIALLKRLGFVEGSKGALCITSEFKRAIEPSISVFDRASGAQVLVDPRGHARKK